MRLKATGAPPRGGALPTDSAWRLEPEWGGGCARCQEEEGRDLVLNTFALSIFCSCAPHFFSLYFLQVRCVLPSPPFTIAQLCRGATAAEVWSSLAAQAACAGPRC